jgi:hypothetical protein
VSGIHAGTGPAELAAESARPCSSWYSCSTGLMPGVIGAAGDAGVLGVGGMPNPS